MSAIKRVEEKRTFEKSMVRLEEIASLLEEGEVDLQTSLERYEEGIRLLRYCTDILATVRQKIAVLHEISESGEASIEEIELENFQSEEDRPGRRSTKKVSRSPKVEQNLQSLENNQSVMESTASLFDEEEFRNNLQ